MRHCVAVHIGTVLWSAVLHAVLHGTQPLQPLQLGFVLYIYTVLVVPSCKYIYFMYFIDSLAFIINQLSIWLEFFFSYCFTIHM